MQPCVPFGTPDFSFHQYREGDLKTDEEYQSILAVQFVYFPGFYQPLRFILVFGVKEK